MEADIASEEEEECGTLKLRSRNGKPRNPPPHEAAAEAETGGELESFVYLDGDEGIKHLFSTSPADALFSFAFLSLRFRVK